MAVTKGLQKAMGEYWEAFLDMSVAAFAVLRENHELVSQFARLALGSVCQPGQVSCREHHTGHSGLKQWQISNFLQQSLMLHVSKEEALVKIRRKLIQAPSSNKTRLKNFVHRLATRE